MVSACVRKGVIGAVATALLAAAPAHAAGSAPFAPPSIADGAALLKAKEWMRRNQNGGDGGLPINGFAARHRVNLWSALGLAAANVNARDFATSPNSRTLFGLLRGFAAAGELSDTTTDLALYLLAAHAVGFSAVRGEQDGPGGHDVVADLLATQLPGTSPDHGAFQLQPGSGSGDTLSTAYAVLALRSLEPFDQSYAIAAVDWLTHHQNGDGSWGPIPDTPGDVETTATVREALTAVGQDASTAASRASSWIGTHQNPNDGGWSRSGDRTPSDVPATAAVARALLAQGVNPNDANNNLGQSPMSFLRSAQDATTGLVGRAPGIPAEEPTQATAIAMLAFGGTGMLFGPIEGGTGADELDQDPPAPPAGLPSGPLLPTETSAPSASTPTAPAPSASMPAPVIQTPATPSSSPARAGVKRVPARRDTGTRGDGPGTVDAGSGSGGGGTVGTPGAPNRDGGGGGVSPGPVSVAAPSVAGAGVPLPTGRTGGKRVKSGRTAPREVSGTLIGRQSATEGARGSSVAVPGAAGAQRGGATTPWWAIALALTILAGIAAGIRLDRRDPELAL